MIQAIGFIIGFYVLTRMIELIQERWRQRLQLVTLLFAVITVFVDLAMMAALATTGSDIPSM